MDQILCHRDTSSPACLIDSGLPDEGADLESETGDDSKIGSDDEVASVHDE